MEALKIHSLQHFTSNAFEALKQLRYFTEAQNNLIIISNTDQYSTLPFEKHSTCQSMCLLCPSPLPLELSQQPSAGFWNLPLPPPYLISIFPYQNVKKNIIMQINIQHIDFFFFFPCDILSGGCLCSLGLPGGIRGLLQSRLMAQLCPRWTQGIVCSNWLVWEPSSSLSPACGPKHNICFLLARFVSNNKNRISFQF